jgi:hypothetical protein
VCGRWIRLEVAIDLVAGVASLIKFERFRCARGQIAVLRAAELRAGTYQGWPLPNDQSSRSTVNEHHVDHDVIRAHAHFAAEFIDDLPVEG